MIEKIKSLIMEWLMGPVEQHKIRLLEKHRNFFKELAEAEESLHIKEKYLGGVFLLWFQHNGARHKIRVWYKSCAWTTISCSFADKTFFPSLEKNSDEQLIPWERMKMSICNLSG